MTTIVEQIGTLFAFTRRDESDPGEEATADGSGEPTATLLHECPECGEIYLSEGSRDCSACGEATRPIES